MCKEEPFELWQHRTIASASLRRLFAPLLPFEKPEIHTGFLRFPNFELGQKSCLRLLAELRGAALYFSAAFTKDFFQNAFYPRRGVSVGGEKLYRTIRQKSSFLLCSMPQRGTCDTQKGRSSTELPRPILRKQNRLLRVRERRRSNLLSRSPGLRFPGHVPAFSEDPPNDRLSSHT